VACWGQFKKNQPAPPLCTQDQLHPDVELKTDLWKSGRRDLEKDNQTVQRAFA
jgi:hypothetical protein